MNRGNILLFFLLFTFLSAFPQSKERLFQFINSNDSNRFAIDIGTTPGITVSSSSVDLSLQYSFLLNGGISISTDLFLINGVGGVNRIYVGLGGGLLARPSLDGFSSDFTLRFPVKYGIKKYKISLIPYAGMTMFKEDNRFIFGVHGNFSFIFNPNSKKKAANN